VHLLRANLTRDSAKPPFRSRIGMATKASSSLFSYHRDGQKARPSKSKSCVQTRLVFRPFPLVQDDQHGGYLFPFCPFTTQTLKPDGQKAQPSNSSFAFKQDSCFGHFLSCRLIGMATKASSSLLPSYLPDAQARRSKGTTFKLKS
jgi:hypothetical protein